MKLIHKPFYFIRHGKTNWNQEGRCQGQIDIPLNTIGKEQAAKLQTQCSALDVSCVYYSPLARAKETMSIACQELDIPKNPLPELKERHLGEWQGRIWQRDMRDCIFQEYMHDTKAHAPPEGAESWLAFYARVIQGINQALQKAKTPILLVGHAGTFWSICKAINVERTHLEPTGIPNCRIIEFIPPTDKHGKWTYNEIQS